MKTNTIFLALIFFAVLYHIKTEKLDFIRSWICEKIDIQAPVELDVVPREQPDDVVITNIASTKYL